MMEVIDSFQSALQSGRIVPKLLDGVFRAQGWFRDKEEQSWKGSDHVLPHSNVLPS